MSIFGSGTFLPSSGPCTRACLRERARPRGSSRRVYERGKDCATQDVVTRKKKLCETINIASTRPSRLFIADDASAGPDIGVVALVPVDADLISVPLRTLTKKLTTSSAPQCTDESPRIRQAPRCACRRRSRLELSAYEMTCHISTNQYTQGIGSWAQTLRASPV
jgi:hypothetical protein